MTKDHLKNKIVPCRSVSSAVHGFQAYSWGFSRNPCFFQRNMLLRSMSKTAHLPTLMFWDFLHSALYLEQRTWAEAEESRHLSCLWWKQQCQSAPREHPVCAGHPTAAVRYSSRNAGSFAEVTALTFPLCQSPRAHSDTRLCRMAGRQRG